jgi:hypothetical protein
MAKETINDTYYVVPYANGTLRTPSGSYTGPKLYQTDGIARASNVNKYDYGRSGKSYEERKAAAKVIPVRIVPEDEYKRLKEYEACWAQVKGR